MKGDSKCVYAKISAISMAVALGVIKGLGMMLFAWAGKFFGYGIAIIAQFTPLYYGYAPTVVGGLYGALWGFIEGFIFGLILAWVYNGCLCCCSYMCKTSNNR